MPSEIEEIQFVQVVNTLAEFVKILVKEYPLVFKNGSGKVKFGDPGHPSFPYEVSLEITKK